MAPRRSASEDQDEIRQTLENFTNGLHDALRSAFEKALTTVLQDQYEKYYDANLVWKEKGK
ncbi:unnamed protein product [Arabis nemorensis]|uniref:Uncharacterized protein n=1 Tax=Arabis nemorensis TaxID=586526 RepID=A0A565C6Q9_9BRAS|nr:unnamed protein product [Arabis nemorensis]